MRWLLLLLLPILAACDGASEVMPRNGEPAPPFHAERLTGGTLAVPHDLRGRVLAIRFWADWCPYCKTEMQALEPVYRRLNPLGLEILAVNVAQDRDTVAAFMRSLDVSYPVLLDPDGATARRYGVTTLPMTWLVDRRGRLAGKIVGEATPKSFEAQIRPLLEAADGG